MADAKLDTQTRRVQLAEAAMALIASNGLRRLSLAAVARRVGLVPSGIYRHFKNKDALIDAVLDRVEERLVANVEAARAESDDPLARLKGVLLRHIRFIREGRAMPRILFSDELDAAGSSRKTRVLKIIGRYRGLLVEIIRDGQRTGQVGRRVDVESAAMLFLGLVIPAGILWHVTEGEFDVTRHAARVWPMYLKAISGTEGNATTVKRRSQRTAR